jgi:hypothetical protein
VKEVVVTGPSETIKADSVNFYDKPKSRKGSKGKIEVDQRNNMSKEMTNLNTDLNSFRSLQNEEESCN